MMISEVEKNTDDITSVAIDINDNKLIPMEEEHGRVCVCRVPKSLTSSKPEAFTPQVVGLGPYHHTRHELIMTDELKLAAAKRIFKLVGLGPWAVPPHAFQIHLSDVQLFYHQDAFISYNSNHHKLVSDVTVDASFLLALLRSAHASRDQLSYFLTGKLGLPLVNALGVELTIDAVIADVFLLENQIPARFLLQVSANDEIEVQNCNLGEKMQSFCEKHCPLDKSEKLCKKPEEHDHLLDLMYNLIVQVKDENKEEDIGDDQLPAFEFVCRCLDIFFRVFSCMMCGAMDRVLQEYKDKGKDKNENENENDEEYKDKDKDKNENENENENENDEEEGRRNRRRDTCRSQFLWLWTMVMCLFSLFFCLCIFMIWYFFSRLLPTLFRRALLSLYYLLKFISGLIYPVVDPLYDSLSGLNQNQFRSLILLVGAIKRACEELKGDSTNSDSRPLVPIPSATELQKAGIGFQPAEGGISSIKFDEGTSMFSLPVMKLDVNSEVIMRNLVAYESLTDSNKESLTDSNKESLIDSNKESLTDSNKESLTDSNKESLTDSNKGLVFTRYIELMKDIIKNGHDVKVLVNRKIIKTKLSEEDVAKVFNGMNKAVRATNCKDLEKVIEKVNGKFDDSQKVKRALIKYVYSAGKFYTVVAALVFLGLTAVQAYCSVYSCSATSKNATMPPPNEDYHKNNYFVSSL